MPATPALAPADRAAHGARGADPVPPGLEAHTGAARADLWIVAMLALTTFSLASAFELHERLAEWTRPLEMWQLDEVPIALLALAAGLAWYALRRAAEARAQLRLRVHAQAQALGLLAHNRELTRRLLEVQESERRALARELHDELGQHCHAIRVEAAFAQRCDDAAQARAAVLRSAGNAEALVARVRALLQRLRPAELDQLGLVAALQALCESWEESSGVACIFRHTGALDGLGENVDTALYRVTQEALTNVLRHARAGQVRVHLQRPLEAPALVELRVDDDGCGFDTSLDTPGLGLLGATERAAGLGGTLHVDSAPAGGTRLCLRVPVLLPLPLPASASASVPGAGPASRSGPTP